MKPTVGEKALELFHKIPDTYIASELTSEQLTLYEEHLQDCYAKGRKSYGNVDFYISVWTKWERALGFKVIRPYFIARRTCPTPQWDQTVYRCHKDSGEIEYLWSLPSKEACEYYTINQAVIPPEEWGILKFVLQDNNGDLLKMAKQLNGEPV